MTSFSGRSRTILEEEPSSSDLSRRHNTSSISNNLIERILRRTPQYNQNIEELIDPEQDYNRFQTHGLQLLSPENLYNRGIFESRTQFFRHTREVSIQCLDGQVRKLSLISEDSKKELKKRNFKFMHLGLIVIGIKGLMRKNLGNKVLITIYDERIQNIEKSMIASTEVDMNSNNGIIYCNPDFLLTIKDFSERIKIGIQTHGYEEVVSGENLLISIGFIGRCSNNSQTKYKVYIDKVINLMSSKGIKMIKPKTYDSETLAGLEWNLDKFLEDQNENIIIPQEAITYKDMQGRTSLRFGNYSNININDNFETESSQNNEQEQQGDEPHTDYVEIELEDKIIYPKELGMNLSKKELLKLEDELFLSRQIKENEYLYYDNSGNIRISIENSPEISGDESKSEISEISNFKELADVDMSIKQEEPDRYIYAGGYPPRNAYKEFDNKDRKYIAKGKFRPLESKIEFQTEHKPQILNITAHDPQTWDNVIEVWKNTIIGHYLRIPEKMEAIEMYKYLETFLGESVKATWEAFKQEKQQDFERLINLGNNPYNFVSKVHELLTGADPNTGPVLIQQKAVRELEQLSLNRWTNGREVKQFLNEYHYLVSISGNTFNQELGNKLFHKLPGPLGLEITKKWSENKMVIEKPDFLWSIGMRTQFVMNNLQQKCVELQIQHQLKKTDYSFCKDIFTPQTYGSKPEKEKRKYKRKYVPRKKKYYLRKSNRRKPYLDENRHVRKFKPERNYPNKLNCFVCGSSEHLAKTCPKKLNTNDKRSTLIECTNEDLLEIDEYISDKESIYSIISIEDKNYINMEEESDYEDFIKEFSDLEFEDNIEFMDIEKESKVRIECIHNWLLETGSDSLPCYLCKWYPSKERRVKCKNCFIEACKKCLIENNLLDIKEEMNLDNIQIELSEIKILRKRIESLEDMQRYILQKIDSLENNKQKGKDIIEETEFVQVFCNSEKLKSIKIKCYIRIENYEINCLGIIDTGCSNCIINKKLVPDKYIIKSKDPIDAQQMDGNLFNYQYILRPAKISFETNCGRSTEYSMPKDSVWIRELNLNTDLILGLSFLLKDNGSILVSKDFLQLQKFSICAPTYIKNFPSEYAEKRGGTIKEEKCECSREKECQLVEEENDFMKIESEDEEEELNLECEFISVENVYDLLVTEQDIENMISKLEKLEILGENVLKYWEKDKVVCELKIKNPEYIIKTKNIEATNQDAEDFKIHIQDLLKLGVIRKSDSPHRSAAFIVRKHSEIIRGKSRMVINYKRLNDNTIDDAYNIPDKNVLINRIQDCNIFSKFDLKSGFWQVKMHPDSIKWTAFTSPEGHYEWLVMPFGLKNAPSIFQRKMEDIFNKHNKFIIVYIDDILVFSKNRREHRGHLQILFSEFIRHGLIVNKKKMHLFKEFIEFLGVNIGRGKIELQPHIAQKALEFPDKLDDLKTLQKFLGLVNYARPFIKDLGKIAGPLYGKISPKGQRFFNTEDVKLVQKIKEKLRNLPKLDMPLDSDYLIIETDGSILGWGAILISKPNKYSDKDTEKIVRYSSGKYKEKGNISSIDLELLAISYALDAFELFIISKKEITLRTDCEAIVSFVNKMRLENRRSNRRRWLNFIDRITNTGIIVNFEHIKGIDNQIADILSRIIKEKDFLCQDIQ